MFMMKQTLDSVFCLALLLVSFYDANAQPKNPAQPVYQDIPYLQDYAIKFTIKDSQTVLKKCLVDRNEFIQILADDGLYLPANGRFQYPGILQPDQRYIPMAGKNIKDMIRYENQFVYLDDQAVLSNAWAGKLYCQHTLPQAELFSGGSDFSFLISDGITLSYVRDSRQLWSGSLKSDVLLDIQYDEISDTFFILGKKALYSWSPDAKIIKTLYKGNQLTCFDLIQNNSLIVIGTMDGYLMLNKTGKEQSQRENNLPWPQLTCIKEINGTLWFGSTQGAFKSRKQGGYDYYYGKRWLPGNTVTHLCAGPENSVLILTHKGLSQICFKEMTLYDKALMYEDQVRQRHIRYGLNSDITRLTDHDLATAQLSTAASDNLWTAMYLASQLFRYLTTGSQEAKQNCYESFEAMERLHTINDIKGLFGRSFERHGYQEFRKEFRSYVDNYWYEAYQGTISWKHADHPEWDWRATASSDQTVGQMFALTLIAEHIDDPERRQRAITLMDDLMTYIVENNFCLVDDNGKPSLWGRWNPDYVNRFDTLVGDRKVYSSNMISFLQTAYHFTGKELFKAKAMELIETHGYLKNLMRPFSEIGPVPDHADAWSRMLSKEWNHSDDEMYFLAYWGLYPYAFDDTLKRKYKWAIKDHWNAERPEKNSLWNFCYAMTGARDFDLEESIWHLREFPLDMIQYEIKNSHRKDITRIEPNFRGQTTSEVLPPDERPELKHNKNLFTLDSRDRNSELSAGDTFLLPYWMGRFLGVITDPDREY